MLADAGVVAHTLERLHPTVSVSYCRAICTHTHRGMHRHTDTQACMDASHACPRKAQRCGIAEVVFDPRRRCTCQARQASRASIRTKVERTMLSRDPCGHFELDVLLALPQLQPASIEYEYSERISSENRADVCIVAML